VLNLAYQEWGWLDRPLGDKLRKKSPKNERHVYLTTEQLGELLQAIPDRHATEKKVIALAALTGLRHSYASLLAQAGESMTTVRDLLGHSSLIVTSRYAHMFEGGLDDIGARLPSLNGAFCDQTATKH